MMMMKTQLVVKYDESDGDKFENSDRFCRNDMMKVMTVSW